MPHARGTSETVSVRPSGPRDARPSDDLLPSVKKANRSCQASRREQRPWETKRVSRGYRRGRGLPQEKLLRCSVNITSRPRRCCFELVYRKTDLRERRMKALASRSGCRRSDSASSSTMRQRRWTTAPFGLHLARQIDPRDVGLYFYAGSAARDLGEALALFSRDCRIANEAFRLTQRSADSAIVFEYVGLPRYASASAGICPAGIRTALRTISGRNLVPTKVTFAHNRNSDVREFERFFGCPVEFGAPNNLLLISADALHLPLITADQKLLRVLRPYCDAAAKDRDVRPGALRAAVEAEVEKLLPAGKAKAENVAKVLRLSLRTLARRLAHQRAWAHGEVVDQLRKSLATQYLNDPGMSLGQIAWLLGYEGSTSFHHAFKRWTGRSPSADR